jgi:poly(3-hydroxybutyrate) depolymerase
MKTKEMMKLLVVLMISACAGKSDGGSTVSKNDSTVTPAPSPSTQASPVAPIIPQPGKLIDTVVSASDPSQSYALYYPAQKAGPLPILFFFDPHGAGALPLRKYKTLADTYGFILAGSNTSKNGNDWNTEDMIYRHFVDDLRSRITHNDNRIYLCGFSGGAKAATYMAMRHPGIKGVIVGGAALPDDAQPMDFPFSLTILAGEGDMNLTDLVATNQALDRTQARHRILFFDGIHQWAPAETMEQAFAGLQMDAMQDGLTPKNQAQIDRTISENKANILKAEGSGRWVRAMSESVFCQKILSGVSQEAGWFTQKIGQLQQNQQYKNELHIQQALLEREQQIKEDYQGHFQQQDRNYWVGVVNRLNAGAKGHTPEAAMNQRLLAFLSLAFYSISNQMLRQNNNDIAPYFVDLYKLVDPTNTEAWYFSAQVNARNHQTQVMNQDLMKAVALGFNDVNRIIQQPEFQGQVNLPGVQQAMRAHGSH